MRALASRSLLVLGLVCPGIACEQEHKVAPPPAPQPAPPMDAAVPATSDAAMEPARAEPQCRSDVSVDGSFELARARTAALLYRDYGDCPAEIARCKIGVLARDQEVLVRSQWEAFTCVCPGDDCYYTPTTALEPLTIGRQRSWVGTWSAGGDKITIERAGNALEVRGSAIVDTHIGEFAGRGTPDAKGLLEIEESSCIVRMRLIDRFLVVEDNNECGGVNVRFWGVFVAP